MRCLAFPLLALFAGAVPAAAQDVDVAPSGPQSVVRIIAQPQFPAGDAAGRPSFAESRCTDFQTLQGMNFGYFGAFALSADGAHGMSGQQHNLTEARAAAIAECDAFRGAATGECRIVAERLPAGHADDTALTLSQMASGDWAEYLTRPGPKAFAIGPVGNYGSSWRGASLPAARRRAMDNCVGAGIDLSPERGSEPCRIIDARP